MNWRDFTDVFADCEILGNKIVIRTRLREALIFIKTNYTYNILKEIIAIDRMNSETELIYHLYSIEDEENIFISISDKVGMIESVSDIFPSAIVDEREIFDLFGIKFLGHKYLKRLYLPESWKGHPLKKDYVQNDARLVWNE